jgi:pimeloyl-ACP methyl ester carboxylesterase
LADLAHIRTPVLDIAYEHSGPAGGVPVILLHGFPYDIRGYDDAVALINDAGFRTIVPYLRGYGPTRFLSKDTIRSGQQAALGQDLLDFMDALRIEKAVVAGYDWGGRAACVVSALWPERVQGLVSCTGYNIQDLVNATRPYEPAQEARNWYQYYFHTERGRNGLMQKRAGIARQLWKMWSPSWDFDDVTFARTAPSFDNADRTASVAGDPVYEAVEQRLAVQPKIDVPTIVLHGADDGVMAAKESENHGRYFTGPFERRVIADAGHNIPQEKPRDFAEAVLELCRKQ